MRIYLVGLLLFLLILPGHTYAGPEVHPDTLQANASYNKGAAFAKRKAFDSARYYLNKAANIYLKENCHDRYFNAVVQVCFTLNAQRKYNRTISYTDSILTRYGQGLKDNFKSAILFYGTIAYAYLYLAQYQETEHYLLKCVDVMTGNPYVTDNNWKWVYYHFARLYFGIGQNIVAINYLDKCLILAEKNNDTAYLSLCYNLKGIIARKTGEYQRSLNYYLLSLNLYKNKPDINKLNQFNNIGWLYHFLGKDSVALTWLDRGLKVLRKFTDDYYSIESNLRNTKAKIFIETRQYEKAGKILNNAMNRELGHYGELTIHSANTLTNLGYLASEMNNYGQAESYYRQTLEIIEKVYGPNSIKIASTVRNIGKCLVEQQKYEEGLGLFQKALTLVVPGFDPQDVSDNPSPEHVVLNRLELLQALQSKSDALLAYYNEKKEASLLHSAIATNNLAGEVFNDVRENLYYGESQKVLTGLTNSLFEQTIHLHMLALHSVSGYEKETHYEAIFNAMEGSKSYALLVALQRSQNRGYSSVPDSINTIETRHLTSIGMYEKQIIDLAVQPEPDSAKLAGLENRLFEAQKSFEQFKDMLAWQYPEYEQSRYHSLTSSLKDTRSGLVKDELIISYFTGKDKMYALGIDRQAVYVTELGDRDMIENRLSDFIGNASTTGASVYQKKALVLHRLLLKQVLEYFPPKKQLVIIPDGMLGLLPFDALVHDTVAQPAFSNLKYEILNYTVTQHYLASLYLRKSGKKESLPGTFIGFAPDFEGMEPVLLARRKSGSTASRAMLNPLPFAVKEVSNISGLVNGQALTGEMATESHFKNEAGNYKYIHVATHSLINARDPLYSRLIFAPEQEDENGEDGVLYAYELYHMNLKGNMVVLSACRTGTGSYQRGEGIISLARGFIYAGASGVLMSLWEVADRSTSEIMYCFYEELNRGKSRGEALRDAKLRYLAGADDMTANPYYWAGFNYLGSREKKSGEKLYVFGALFLILLVLGGIVYMKRTAS